MQTSLKNLLNSINFNMMHDSGFMIHDKEKFFELVSCFMHVASCAKVSNNKFFRNIFIMKFGFSG